MSKIHLLFTSILKSAFRFNSLKKGICLVIILSASLTAAGQQTWYSYRSGDWNHHDTWTTDPGGTTLAGTHTLVDGNTYVILTDRTVELTENVTQTGLSIILNDGGIIQMGVFEFSEQLTLLSGQGTIRLHSTSLPAASTNDFILVGGGTYEFNTSGNFNLPISTYNNLTLNLGNTTNAALLTGNVTLNGNLSITRGIFQINDNSPRRLWLTIKGNVNVASGSSILTGAGNTTTTANPNDISGGTAPFVNYYINNTHTVEVFGNFINNGNVRFTNQAYPVYNAFPSNGAASVFFRGAANNTITCNGPTDFYNLIMDKGEDQTWELSINSSEYHYFRLFGANVSGGEGGGSNPILKKALWLKNGSLRLFGKVVIPSLSEGTCNGGLSGGPNSDYYVPANSAFIIEGPDVVVLTTADDYREVNAAYGVSIASNAAAGINSSAGCSSISILGKFQVNNGYVSTRESGGFIYWGTSAGEFIINGGTLDAKQLRTAGSSGGLTAYRQTGGTLSLRGRLTQNVTGVTTVADLRNVPLSGNRSGGGLEGSLGTFNIDRDDNIFEMTGGIIEILDVAGINSSISRAFQVNSLPEYYNVTGGTIIIKPTTAGGTDYPYDIVSSAPIYNLSIERISGTQPVRLTNIPAKTGVTARLTQQLTVINDLTLSNNAIFNANNYELQAGGNFSLPSGTTYTPGTNLTTFNGPGNQSFTGGGTITSNFNKLKIDKPSGTFTFAGAPATYTIRDSLIIKNGTLDDGGKTINVAGNIFVGGIHTGEGKIVLNGPATQTIEADVFSTPELGNIELNNFSQPGALLLSDLTAKKLTLNANTGSRSIFDIQSFHLLLTDNIILSTGTLNFGNAKMVVTDGSIGANGLTTPVTLTGDSSPDFLFPIGVKEIVGASTNYHYNPFTLLTPGNPGTTTGMITVIPKNEYHSTVNKPADVIRFYWSIKATGFQGAIASGFRYFFLYYGVIDNNQNSASYLDYNSNDGWETAGSVNQSNRTITYNNNLGFLSTDFTAGKKSAFNKPRLLYSRISGEWHNKNTWSEVSHTGGATNKNPETFDRLIIGGSGTANHQITMTDGLNSVAGVEILSTDDTDIQGTPPTLIKPATINAGYTLTYVTGGGRYQQFNQHLPAGDYTQFCNNETAIFEYAGGAYTIPATLAYYPNLHITSDENNSIKTLPNANILVRQNLRLISGNTENKLQFNNSTTARTFTVYGDIEFTNNSQLIVPATTGQKTINIHGDINFRYNNTDNVNGIVATSGPGTIHNLNFYGSTITSGNSQLAFYNGSGTNQMNLNLLGEGDVTITNTTGAATNFTLNRLVINKENLTDNIYFQNNFILGAATNGASKALSLIKGTLNLEHQSTNINLSSGGANFQIPQSAAMILKNGATVSVTGNNTGIFLDGLLRAQDGSIIDLGNGGNTNTRYIEYSGSGNAAIELTGTSSLTVNSQIRRSLAQTNGVLKFSLSNQSEAIIFGQGVDQTRGKLEIVNPGSHFNMSNDSKLTIVRGGGTTFGDLYLRPSSANVSGGEIYLGTATTGGQTIRMDASIPLNNLNIVSPVASNTVQLMVNPLRLNGSLAISTNSIFNANNIDVSLRGDLTNNWTYRYGTEGNTTTFDGIIQTIQGDRPVTFHNLVVSSATSLTLNHDQIIENNLTINSGTLIANTHDIIVEGNLTNNASHNSSTGKLILNGNNGTQGIYGAGTYGLLELDNDDGARLYNSISLTKDFYLTNGILNINQYLLTLGPESNIIIPGGTEFGTDRMITPDGVFSNIGIRKHFPASFTGEFIYPLGVTGTPDKYTPAILRVTSTNAGYVRINAINDRHPATLPPLRVLNYFWETEGAISGFTGDLSLFYDDTDIKVEEDDDEFYVAARVIAGQEDSWSKAAEGSDTDNVDEDLNKIFFNFGNANNLGGQYTAGFDLDIPDIIPTFTSKEGVVNWDVSDNWSPAAPAGGPNGFIVVIPANSTVKTNGNRRFAYRTTINGKLEIGETYGHNLGTVDGTGTLSLEDQILPAGRFTRFFNCAGGTLEFGGSKDYTIIASLFDTLRNIHFTGTGQRLLPNKDLVICNEFKIDGPAVINNSNRQLTIGGTMVRNSGTFAAGTGPGASVRFAGQYAQTLAGFNESTLSALNNIEIHNPEGLTLQSQIDFNGNLKLTQGNIYTTSAHILYMRNTSGNAVVTPSGGSQASYVSGPLRRYIFGGSDFTFPSGKGSRYGRLTLDDSYTGNWTAEYFNSAYPVLTSDATLNTVSNTEYWQITSPNNTEASAKVQLRWDELSDISPASTTGGITDIRLAGFNGSNWSAKSATATGNNNSGTIKTVESLEIKQTGHPQYYTLGSVSAVTAMARFSFSGEACTGALIPVTFSGVTSGDLNYELTYTIDGVIQSPIVITTLPFQGIPATNAGVYRLSGFRYRINGVPVTGNIDNTEVTINPSPNPPAANNVARCGPGTVQLTATGAATGEDYRWYTASSGGTLLHTGNTFTTPYLNAPTTNYYVAKYNTSTGCESARTNVQAIISSKPVFIMTGSADQLCHGESYTLTINLTSVNYPYTIILTENSTLIEDGTLTYEDSQFIYQVDEMQWNGSTPDKQYSYTVTITDVNGCTSDPAPSENVTIWKIPETGPQYHIPNTFGH